MTPTRPTVLIGFAEALAAPECAWSLLDAGFNVAAFTRSGARPPLRHCRDVHLVPITPPELDAQAAVHDLARAAHATGSAALLPLDDVSVWLADRAAHNLPCLVAGPTGARARFALDKRLQLPAAEEAGLLVPPTRVLFKRPESLDDLEFPLVVKPACAVSERAGRLTRGTTHVCADRRELECALATWNEEQPVLIQPFIPGTGEGLFGLATPHAFSHWSAHVRLRMMNPAGSGSSACRSATVDASLAARVERLLRAQNWHGLFMVEFLRDPAGRPWFMEVNGRAFGSMALARRRGFEYPAWTVAGALDPSYLPPPVADADPGICRHLGRELLHLVFVWRGPRSRALTQYWPSRTDALRAVLRVSPTDRWYNYRPGNRAVFWADTWQTVLSHWRRRPRLNETR